MTKNLSFFAFYGPFHELLRIGLGVPGRFKMTVRPDKYLRAWTKLLIFVFYGRFHELLPIILGFQGNLHVWELWEKTCRFCVLCPFSWVIDNSFVVPGRFKMTLRPDTCLSAWTKTFCFRVLWPFSWDIAHSFGVPRGFAWGYDPVHVWELWPKTRRFRL